MAPGGPSICRSITIEMATINRDKACLLLVGPNRDPLESSIEIVVTQLVQKLRGRHARRAPQTSDCSPRGQLMAHTGQRHSGHEAHFIGICFGTGVFTKAWPESRHQTVAAPSFGACPCTDPRPAPSPPGTVVRTPTGLMAARDDAARWGRETTSTSLRLAYREAG